MTVEWGDPYVAAFAYLTRRGLVWMRRKGQRVRFYNAYGAQVGPEQENAESAYTYAHTHGWRY